MSEQLKSSLPHGKPSLVADRDLWFELVKGATTSRDLFDVLQRYADIRGISRQDAKNETFMLRYSGLAGVTHSMKFPNVGTVTARFDNVGKENENASISFCCCYCLRRPEADL